MQSTYEVVVNDKHLVDWVNTIDMLFPIVLSILLLAERAHIDFVAVMPALHGAKPFCGEEIIT